MTALQQEAYHFIDSLSQVRLEAFMSFIREFINASDRENKWEMVIETDLTDEEKAICERGREEYLKHPENFIKLDEYINRQ